MGTISRTLAAVTAGAALTLAPFAMASAAADVLTPDEEFPHDPNQADPAYWEEFLLVEEDIEAVCDIFESPLTVPDEPASNVGWILAAAKGNAEAGTAELFWEPFPGDVVAHTDGGNAWVVLCAAEFEEEEPEPEPTETSSATSTPTSSATPSTSAPATGPVVETDQISDGGSGQATLLLLGAGGLLAASGAVVASRRRASAEH